MGTEETQVTEGAATEEVVNTETASKETPAAATTDEEKAALEAKGTTEPEKETEEETEEPEVGADGKPVAKFTPNMKVKVGFYKKEIDDYEQKEFAIDKKFAALMKDPESEKLVRELHEKAYGLDSVKERLADAKTNFQAVVQENQGIKGSIDSLRGIVQTARTTGNLLKLDDFFDRLKIPQEMIMKYALAKVQYSELPPEQQAMLKANMDADRQRETLDQQLRDSANQTTTMAQKLMAMELDHTLARAEYKSIADEWDARNGKPGAFYDLVAQVGELAWLQSNGKVTLTPEQAVQHVIKGYGLKAPAPGTGTVTPAPAASADAGKRIIQRTTNTIPNVQGRSSSPLKGKPKSVEDIKKIYDDMVAREA